MDFRYFIHEQLRDRRRWLCEPESGGSGDATLAAPVKAEGESKRRRSGNGQG